MRAASTEDYTVLMDYLQFDNDVAFNFFVTETDMATTLVLSEDQGTNSIAKSFGFNFGLKTALDSILSLFLA